MAFLDDSARHTAKMVDRVRSPRHLRSTLSPTASLVVPVAKQVLKKMVTPKQFVEQNQQELSEAVHKSLEMLVYGCSSLSDPSLWQSSFLYMPHTHLPLSSVLHTVQKSQKIGHMVI